MGMDKLLIVFVSYVFYLKSKRIYKYIYIYE